MGLTNDKNDPGLKKIDSKGLQEKYLVLSKEERAKGFIRPLRLSYEHVGLPAPKNPLKDLTPEQKERYQKYGYVKYEEYPKNKESSAIGRYWTQEKLDKINNGCGVVTTMNLAIAETYAMNPDFYGATYCAGCQVHLPVGEDGEFVWEGTNIRVGA